MVNQKVSSPNTCGGCAVTPFPFTLPADISVFYTGDGNWAGNGPSNTTLPDFILPTVGSALAAGHQYGDTLIISRDSSYNILGITNTDLTAPLLIAPIYTSVGFVLGYKKWHRSF